MQDSRAFLLLKTKCFRKPFGSAEKLEDFGGGPHLLDINWDGRRKCFLFCFCFCLCSCLAGFGKSEDSTLVVFLDLPGILEDFPA